MDATLLAIAIGLVVSLVVTEVFGLSVGGMIVPGYIALSMHHPIAVVMTIVAALVTWGIIRQVSRWVILYGRRRVVLTMLFGFVVGTMFRLLANSLAGVPAEDAMNPVVMIGFIIPGLIALWFERQGFIETLSPMMSAAVLVRLTLITIGVENFS
ncbi:Capsule biosynthesis protein CapC [Rosistilla oblonga]|uniref:poly-gamma-glutamate biosynthesis protein PgsC n=1 Tax=Rosistilla oblonga TaxID=2527990 RepID=UPI0011877B86|nr:poly-gamma-glutamate biosynthesis protein PgsC [Rosistilla oblonga]QDV14495.1 Capsule biosynthesis protein CapC [Rosistilla oblonga]